MTGIWRLAGRLLVAVGVSDSAGCAEAIVGLEEPAPPIQWWQCGAYLVDIDRPGEQLVVVVVAIETNTIRWE